MKFIFYSLLIIVLFSCTSKTPNQNHIDFEEFVNFKYAKGITITKTTQGNIVTILNPQSGKILDNFIITKEKNHNFTIPKVIQLPISNIITYSSTYLSFIDILNEIKKVKGRT
mgnify:CR=1 FL=1